MVRLLKRRVSQFQRLPRDRIVEVLMTCPGCCAATLDEMAAVGSLRFAIALKQMMRDGTVIARGGPCAADRRYRLAEHPHG